MVAQSAKIAQSGHTGQHASSTKKIATKDIFHFIAKINFISPGGVTLLRVLSTVA